MLYTQSLNAVVNKLETCLIQNLASYYLNLVIFSKKYVTSGYFDVTYLALTQISSINRDLHRSSPSLFYWRKLKKNLRSVFDKGLENSSGMIPSLHTPSIFVAVIRNQTLDSSYFCSIRWIVTCVNQLKLLKPSKRDNSSVCLGPPSDSSNGEHKLNNHVS